MAIQTDNKGQIVQASKGNGSGENKTLADLVIGMKGAIEQCIPKHLTADRMTRIAVTAIRTNKDLAICTPHSFIACLMACSMLGLEPNTPLGQAYLIPRNRKGQVGKDCTLVIGYQGMIDLARRSGQVASIQAFAVYEGDSFSYELGLRPTITHVPSGKPDREDPKKLTHAYCVVKLKDKDADPVFLVMTREQIEARRRRSAAANSGPWVSDYEQMALKTTVRACIKWAPRSAEMATALDIDERTERGAAIVPALSQEVESLLLESGHVTDAEFTEDADLPQSDTNGAA